MKILIVDDNEANLTVLESYLVAFGFSPQKARDGSEALKKVAKSFPDLILLDLMMPRIDGFEVTRRLKSDPKTFKIPIVAITALHDRESNIKAIRAGVDGFLTKPIDEVILKAHINSILKIKRLHSELDDSKDRLNNIREYHRRLAPGRSRTREIIGNSNLIKETHVMIDMFKNLELPVLVSGESGTGKQLAVEAMHWNGRRASEPFVHINCAGLQENLLEGELFGYAKGAFTGAVKHKQGLIEVAERGTLFVDEIGDMSSAVQAKILTVLDSGLFRRLGETTERKANVRIVAATNYCLEKEIKKGRFRLDLFYRLNVFEINMPPLRKRKEDIPMLIDYFLSHSSLTKTMKKTFSAQAIEAFQKYDWPGNVRELYNAVERAILFSGQDDKIAPRHLSPELTCQSRTAPDPSIVHSISDDDYQPSRVMTLKELETAYIKEVLKKEKDNRTRAARILGISRSTIKKKIADWELAG
ncbi:MAG: sigma-54-dependent Fis family transcriptional regulator [Desulfobacterales bacterium]|nr:sigma-54-dependent Fis family transcriptional regulator [Desulfobacterales bacterium]